MRKWITMLLVTCLPGVAWGQGRTGGGTQAQQAVKKADEAFAANRLREAIRLYSQALTYNRALTPAYEKLAIAYYAVRQYRAAVNKLGICLQVAPANVKCNMWMGMHLLKLKKRAQGIAALQKAVKLNWKLPLAMRKLGSYYYKKGNWRRAEKAWWTFLRFRDRTWPKKVDFAAHYYLGKIYLEMKRYPAAATAYTKATKLRRKHSGAKLGLATAYIGRKYFNAALNLLLPLRKLARRKPIIHFYLARCFYRMRRKQKALSHLKHYADKRPHDVRSLILKGDIYLLHNEFGPALAAYKQATLKAPGSMEAKVKYGEALLQRKRAKEAYAILSAAARQRPRNPRVLRVLGQALLALRRAKEAIAVFTRLLQARPGTAEGVALRGDAHLMANQVSQAISDYQTAQKLNKRSWRAKQGLIRALSRRARDHLVKKNTAAALADLNRAFALDPKRISTNTNLGIAYLMAKRHKEAARHLAEVHKRLPRNFAVIRLLGRLYYDTGRLNQARAHYMKARQAAKRLPARFQAEVNQGHRHCGERAQKRRVQRRGQQGPGAPCPVQPGHRAARPGLPEPGEGQGQAGGGGPRDRPGLREAAAGQPAPAGAVPAGHGLPGDCPVGQGRRGLPQSLGSAGAGHGAQVALRPPGRRVLQRLHQVPPGRLRGLRRGHGAAAAKGQGARAGPHPGDHALGL
jgi:tetratricopeptide (TPR) repeat protein